jgi:hypothetical protein
MRVAVSLVAGSVRRAERTRKSPRWGLIRCDALGGHSSPSMGLAMAKEMQLGLERQRSPVADEVSAITAVARPILIGTLYALQQCEKRPNDVIELEPWPLEARRRSRRIGGSRHGSYVTSRAIRPCTCRCPSTRYPARMPEARLTKPRGAPVRTPQATVSLCYRLLS